jgi:hypothetical protein
LPYFFAILTTSLRLLRTNWSLAQGSFSSVISLPKECSSSIVSREASSISFRYSFMVASNAIAASRPAEVFGLQPYGQIDRIFLMGDWALTHKKSMLRIGQICLAVYFAPLEMQVFVGYARQLWNF